MYKIAVFCLIALATITVSCREQTSPQGWELVWEDNFDNDLIDCSVWSKTPRQMSDWNNTMSNIDELYSVIDGKLILRGIKNTNLDSDTSRCLTAGIWSKEKKNFPPGRFDVRAKFTCAQGFWPAIWLMPARDNTSPDFYSEIDIMEHLNFDGFVYQTLHSTYTLEGNRSNPVNHVRADIDVDDFNIYSVEIHSDSVVFLTNDVVSYTYPRLAYLGESQFPFDKFNYYIILSAQLGGNWVGEINMDDLPVELEVDWIRYFIKK